MSKEEYINAQYDIIVNKVSGSRLFGELVDISDHKTLVVCAHGLGEYEVREEHIKDMRSLNSIK